MRKLLLLLTLLTYVSLMEAQKAGNSGSVPKLAVWLKSGEKVVFELSDVPVTTFSGDQLVIRTNKVTSPYERKDVLCYT